MQHYCVKCGDDVPRQRWVLGIKLCLDCGEVNAKLRKHTIVPMHKSNYVVVTDLQLLVGINSKQVNRS
jgi:ribosomal protein L37AE/L43A